MIGGRITACETSGFTNNHPTPTPTPTVRES